MPAHSAVRGLEGSLSLDSKVLEFSGFLVGRNFLKPRKASFGSSSSYPWLLSLDIDELRAECKAKSENIRVFFRIPPSIRILQPHRYDPLILPMGMYNRDFRKKTPLDQLKLEIVSVFLEHLEVDNNGWSRFCREVAETEGKVSGRRPSGPSLQHYYQDDVWPSFVTPELELSVLIIDAFFIVTMFIFGVGNEMCGAWNLDPPPVLGHLVKLLTREDVACNLPVFIVDILWSYECQIPLFLIENLWAKTVEGRTGNRVKDSRFGDVITRLVEDALEGFAGFPYKADGKVEYSECDHLLACLHKDLCSGIGPSIDNDPASRPFMDNDADTGRFTSYIHRVPLVRPLMTFATTMSRVNVRHPTITRSSAISGTYISLPSATCLRKSGIRFKGVDANIDGIRFVKSLSNLTATLYLPKVRFDCSSKRNILNICAYECMSFGVGRPWPVTSYFSFMDELIDSEEDVELLMYGKNPVIIANNVGDNKDLANMFDHMLQNFVITADQDRFSQLKAEVNIWYNTRWRRQLTGFLDQFVISPWLLVCLIVATILLILSLLQTIFTMWRFYKQY
ncbi:hypothetical protein R1sor_025745 [Riccia sorocarpa]|uniref:Uncharacterized protein n=1 Tax=Riccia sorocarpa TaxID=122646 RepID=A0ABD3G9H2_9MARC